MGVLRQSAWKFAGVCSCAAECVVDGKLKCAVLECRWMHPECYLPRRMQPDDPSGNLGFLKASVDVSPRLHFPLFA